MKGVILAGGLGTRLYPATRVTNKHLLPVYDKPMVFYPLHTLIRAGIIDILIVSGPDHTGHFLRLLHSGKEFRVRLKYDVQEEPSGIAKALSLAEDFAGGDKIVVILGDNIFEDDIAESVALFKNSDDGARLFLKEVPDVERFAAADINGTKIVSIKEKPKNPKSNLAVTGLYMYDSNVFDIIRTLKPSARGQYEITDVNNEYVRREKVSFRLLNGFWSDAGTHESLFRATEFVRRFPDRFKF